jgi:hypothetical protein
MTKTLSMQELKDMGYSKLNSKIYTKRSEAEDGARILKQNAFDIQIIPEKNATKYTNQTTYIIMYKDISKKRNKWPEK